MRILQPMKRWTRTVSRRQRKLFQPRTFKRHQPCRLAFEPLEVRQMLDSEMFSASLPVTPTDFGPVILSLSQFDTQGGYRILDQIDLNVNLQMDTSTTGSLTNTGASQAQYKATVNGTGTASGPAIVGLTSIVATDTGFIIVPGNTSVAVPPTSDSDPQSESHMYTDAVNLALFTGVGTMDYSYSGLAGTSISIIGGGNLNQNVSIVTTGLGSANVTYTFHLAAADVAIVKLTNGTDNNSPTGPNLLIGSPVTWTYNVTNPGNVELANVSVVDDQMGVTPVFDSGDTDMDGRLDPDETWVYLANGIAALGQYVNTGTVTGTPVDANGDPIMNPNVPTTVMDSDLDHYFGQALTQTRISISADGVNEVGQSHDFAAFLEFDDGLPANMFGGDAFDGFAPYVGQTVTVNLDGVNGAVPDLSAPIDELPSDPSVAMGLTDANGFFTVSFTSATAGKVIGNAYFSNGVAVDTDPNTPDPADTSDPNGGSGPAVKRFVDANITISADAVNAVGESHTFTVTVNQDDGLNFDEGGDGVTGFAPVSGAAVTVNLDGTNGAIPDISAPSDLAAADPSSIMGLTNGSGQFDVTFSSATAGKVTGNGYTTFVLDGVNLVRDTDPTTVGDGSGPNGSGPALKRFVDANITISADGVNAVGAPHTFTVTVNQDDGLNFDEGGDGVTGFAPVSGAAVTVNLDGTNGAIPDISAPSDEAAADPSIIMGLTNGSGQFDVTFSSATAGKVTGNGYATFILDGVNLERDTDPTTVGVGSGPNGSGPALKRFVDANITISADGVNAVGDPHTFTVTVNQDDGLNFDEGGDGVTGFAPVSGAAVTVNLDGTNGAIPDISAPSDLAAADPSIIMGLTNGSGQFDVTFSSATAGKVTGNGYTTFILDGVNLARDTDPTTVGDGSGPNGSGPALKRFVDANITIGVDGTNPVNAPHIFTITVNQDDGLNFDEGGDGVTGFAPVNGANVTMNLDGNGGAIPDVSAPSDLLPADPTDVIGVTNASGQFAVTFSSATAGTVTGNGYVVFMLDGVNLVRDTDLTTIDVGSGPNGSGPTVKTFVAPGHTATIGFWHNKNGKAVILSSASTDLANWLATNFPNLYGSLAGATNTQVYNFFVSGTNSYFGTKGTKTNAQVMAVALAVYFTDVSNTATAQSFGFGGSLGNVIVSVNGNAMAFAGYLEAGGTTISINNMLAAANFYAAGGVIYGGSGSKWKMINDQFSFVNEMFDI